MPVHVFPPDPLLLCAAIACISVIWSLFSPFFSGRCPVPASLWLNFNSGCVPLHSYARIVRLPRRTHIELIRPTYFSLDRQHASAALLVSWLLLRRSSLLGTLGPRPPSALQALSRLPHGLYSIASAPEECAVKLCTVPRRNWTLTPCYCRSMS